MDNVIIVDKTPSIHRLIEVATRLNLRVIETSNSIQTLNRIRASDDIKLIIIDVLLEKEDGFELVKEIKYINPNIPVMILTSLNGRMDFVRGVKVGASDYILKPFDDDALIGRIRKLLKAARVASSNPDTASGIDFNSYLDSEINKSIKGGYPLSIGMIVLYKSTYNPEHYDSDYMKYQDRLYKKFKKIFFEVDLFIPYGTQSFLTIMPFCAFDNIHIVRDKIMKKSNDFIADLQMEDFHVATSFVNLPADGKSRDELIDKLLNQIQENISNQKTS
ncbi:MAG: response regulator [Acidaminobacteraceae bacterium]